MEDPQTARLSGGGIGGPWCQLRSCSWAGLIEQRGGSKGSLRDTQTGGQARSADLPRSLPAHLCPALQTLFRRNSVYIGTIIVGAFVGERVRCRTWLGAQRSERARAACAKPPCLLGARGQSPCLPGPHHPALCHPNLPCVWVPAVQLVHQIGDSLWESHNQGVSRVGCVQALFLRVAECCTAPCTAPAS